MKASNILWFAVASTVVAAAFFLASMPASPGLAQPAEPDVAIESPRLKSLQRALAAGGDTVSFWNEMHVSGGPLVELGGEGSAIQPPLNEDSALVTFLWRGSSGPVNLLGGPEGGAQPLQRLGQSDVWLRSYRVPLSARLVYRFEPRETKVHHAIDVLEGAAGGAQRDPLNARSFPEGQTDIRSGFSLLELSGAPKSAWVDRRDGIAAGAIRKERLTSAVLGNTREIALYKPPGWRPGMKGNGLLVVFDGDVNMRDVPVPTILDNLIAQREIPPTAAIFVGESDREKRDVELPPNPAFAEFVVKELMPWARLQGVFADASSTVVAGQSFGGLAAAYMGFLHPEVFGNVFAQSGSFWWRPTAPENQPEVEREWLTRQYANAPKRPVVFYVEAGFYERGILRTTRNFRDVLRDKGYTVQYAESATGHDYAHWRETMPDGIRALLGKGAAPR